MKHGRGHGGFGWKEGLLDFSSNVNPLGTPEELVKLIHDAVTQRVYMHHPSELGDELREAIAKYEGVNPDLVYAFNGATEALQLITMYLRPNMLCVLVPNYTDYFRIAGLIGLEVKTFEYWGLGGIGLDMARDCGPNSLIILSNPNTPLGYLIEPGDLMRLIEDAERLGAHVLVDESFMDFVKPGKSLISKVEDFRGLIVVKSYTKFLAIPGLRVGAAFTGMAIEDLVPTWPINSIAEYAVSRYLPKASSFREETIGFIAREGARVLSQLLNLGIEVFNSKTHYFTFKSVHDLGAILKGREILIRDLSNVPPLGPGFFRFSLRGPQDNDKLIGTLMSVLRDKK